MRVHAFKGSYKNGTNNKLWLETILKYFIYRKKFIQDALQKNPLKIP